jgi:hypothetical protein
MLTTAYRERRKTKRGKPFFITQLTLILVISFHFYTYSFICLSGSVFNLACSRLASAGITTFALFVFIHPTQRPESLKVTESQAGIVLNWFLSRSLN